MTLVTAQISDRCPSHLEMSCIWKSDGRCYRNRLQYFRAIGPSGGPILPSAFLPNFGYTTITRMDGFRILTNRRRTVIALVHTVVFLAIAVVQLALSRPTPHFQLHASTTLSSAIMVGIYFAVTAVLLLLFRISRCFNERIYFALCATSASFGLLRAVYGDPPMHVAHYFRVVMLSGAVLVGILILRSHSEVATD
jgi:hypothetical protein